MQFGNVLGADGKILKTRSGDPIRLRALLDEAIERAAAVLAETQPELPEPERAVIARQVGIGAVKYADLSVAHDSDYIFDLDRMVALDRQHRRPTCSTPGRGSGRSCAAPRPPPARSW